MVPENKNKKLCGEISLSCTCIPENLLTKWGGSRSVNCPDEGGTCKHVKFSIVQREVMGHVKYHWPNQYTSPRTSGTH